MHIVHIASEFAPLAKAGGLGDAVFGLAQEQQRQGHHVTVIMPCYGCIDRSQLRPYLENFWVTEHRTPWQNTLWQIEMHGLCVLLVQTHHTHECFQGKRVYRGTYDVRRFLFFSKIVAQFLDQNSIPCDVLHLHDWHAALIPYLLRDSSFSPTTVYTIHNMKYQGRCHMRDLCRIGLKGSEVQNNPLLRDTYNSKRANMMRAGLEYADQITTVSCRYAEEIASPKFACGLDRIVCKHKEKFTGITNGIDYTYWNPETDTQLPCPYAPDPQKIPELQKAKQKNKEALYQQLGLSPSAEPLIVVVSRLVSQKGPWLIIEALRYTEKAKGAFVILGAVGEPQYERPFSRLQEHYHNSAQVSIQLQFDEPLSRLLFAAADCILVPSLFEPCGLTQMIALRYGTIPIVRKTGGLADTVVDPEEDPTQCNGIVFEKPNTTAIHNALDRVLHYYHNEPKFWQTLIKNGLQRDFSWEVAQQAYADVYHQKIQNTSLSN